MTKFNDWFMSFCLKRSFIVCGPDVERMTGMSKPVAMAGDVYGLMRVQKNALQNTYKSDR